MRPPTCSSSFSSTGRDRRDHRRHRCPHERRPEKSAALLGLGFDHEDGQTRITRGKNFVLCGGGQETHADARNGGEVNERLDQRGKHLENVLIGELRDICRDIRDSVGGG